MQSNTDPVPAKTPHKILHIFGYIFIAIFIGLGIWYAKNRQAQNIVSGVVSSPINVLKNLGGRTNVLLLGIGGKDHEGGDLTDSMLLISFNLSKNTADMIPLPRDIWIASMKAKINTAYHYGNDRRSGGGRDLVKSAVSEILGIPVHYVVVLDFQGFEKAIDSVGGIDVDVTNTFDDFEYPIPGRENAEPVSSRYEHVHFDAGKIHMNGSTALKFARSRHASGDEGTDFARSARQQKILAAFRAKVLSLNIIFNTNTLSNLKNSLISSIDTDITSVEQGTFLKVFIGLSAQEGINSISLTEFLKNPKNIKEYGGQWVLIPTPSLEDLQSYVKTQLEK